MGICESRLKDILNSPELETLYGEAIDYLESVKNTKNPIKKALRLKMISDAFRSNELLNLDKD